MSDTYHWATRFGELFVSCCDEYEEGNQEFGEWFDEDDLMFLESIGHTTREVFDFVEDCCSAEGDEPTPETALLVAAVRRDYFLVEQGGVASTNVVSAASLPPKAAELAGVPWLPRIIAKAEAKLRGEMDPDIMFGCGGDRAFLSEVGIHPADFLRMIWAAKGDQDRVVKFVKTGEYS
ncbi:hypothetical protein [Phragmitibacter flavus]|uniref:hypothetical protein n=1 Tax=Phragmitibacter flavus TaxID=2576071 RepID=UPI00140B563E|nr:hypothetical protein [Phragmitibacter flavus]